MRLDLGDEVIFDDDNCGAILRGNLSYSMRSHTYIYMKWHMGLSTSLWDCLRFELSRFLIEDSQDES